MSEAEELCDQIAIINKGELVTCQPTKDLLSTLDSKELIVTINNNLTEVPKNLSEFNVELRNGQELVFHVPPSEMPVEKVLGAIRGEGFSIQDLTTKESDLEDIFLMLTQESDQTGLDR